MTQTKSKWVKHVLCLQPSLSFMTGDPDHSGDKFLEKINHDVLAQLLQEGGVAEDLLVLPELLHGDLLQGSSGVMNGCRENKIRFYPEKKC